MGWVVRELVKALLPTVVVPALVAGLIFYRFGLTTEFSSGDPGFHPAYLAMLEYKPEFNIEIGIPGMTSDSSIIRLENMVRHAAKASTRIYL